MTLAASEKEGSVVSGVVTDADGRLIVVGSGGQALGQATTSGGLSVHKRISAATTNAVSVKASAGQVYGWHLSNTNAAVRFFKLYNLAVAPTVGTSVPFMTLSIPGGGSAVFNNQAAGIVFDAGIAFATTTLATDVDATAVAVNEIVINLFYK